MNKATDFIGALLAHDKLLHFIGGQVIFIASLYFTGDMIGAHWITATVAAGKEIFVDGGRNLLAKRKGLPPPATVDWVDALATYLGAIFMTGSLHLLALK